MNEKNPVGSFTFYIGIPRYFGIWGEKKLTGVDRLRWHYMSFCDENGKTKFKKDFNLSKPPF